MHIHKYPHTYIYTRRGFIRYKTCVNNELICLTFFIHEATPPSFPTGIGGVMYVKVRVGKDIAHCKESREILEVDLLEGAARTSHGRTRLIKPRTCILVLGPVCLGVGGEKYKTRRGFRPFRGQLCFFVVKSDRKYKP